MCGRRLTPHDPQINQTGDLSNLSGLPASELVLLPTLLELRDALYSKEFRSFVQEVTGCGPLSGIKTDMSCAEYSEGCYLLNHDDVIGSRRISFILYLVLDEPAWQPEVRLHLSAPLPVADAPVRSGEAHSNCIPFLRRTSRTLTDQTCPFRSLQSSSR